MTSAKAERGAPRGGEGFRVLITRRLPGNAEAHIARTCAVEVGEQPGPMERRVLLDKVRGCDAVISCVTDRIDAEVMEAAGARLRHIANFAVGVDNVDLPAAAERGIGVSNTPDVLTETTADLAWALILSAARRVVEGDALVRAGRFTAWEPDLLLGVDVWGKTLGIVGAGRIGRAVARRARGFAMPVIYTARRRLDRDTEVEHGMRYAPLDELLAAADFVSLHCPATPATHHLLGARELALLRPTAVLVNTARGSVVDEGALAAALGEGRIFAAGLDVYEDEPRLHPGLEQRPNAVLLPHVGSASRETRERMARMNAEDVLRVAQGLPPLRAVTAAR